MATLILKELSDNIEENKDFIIKLFNKIGYQLLMEACTNGYIELVKLLIENGADVKYNDYYAFRLSVAYKHLELTKFLLEIGADVNTHNDYSIKVVIDYNNFDMFKLLIEYGATVPENYICRCQSPIKEYLVAIKNIPYYGLCSLVKLDIQLPDLQEIIKDNKYYYVYRYKYVDNCYVLEEQEKKISILNSLNLENKVTLGLFLNLS